MSRKDEVASSYTKPAAHYLEWDSESGEFMYYDKQANEGRGAKVPINLTKFLFLKQMHTIKGWSEKHEAGMYAAEITDLSKEPLTVKTFSGTVIAKGLYSEIKEKLKDEGGRYTASIYAMLPDGTCVNFQMKGVALRQWMEFTQKTRARLADEWVKIKEVQTGKKGKVTFTFPIFEFDKSLSAKEADLADQTYATLKDALNPSARRSEPSTDEETGFTNVDVIDEF